MKKISKRFVRVMAALVLIAAMAVGMTGAMGRKAKAGNNQHIGEYRLRFDFGGVSPYSYEQWYGAGVYAGLPANPSRPGFTFGGWKCNGHIYKGGEVIRVMNNMDFTAVWYVKVKVTFALVNLTPGECCVPYEIRKTVNAKYNSTVGSILDTAGIPSIGSQYTVIMNPTSILFTGRSDNDYLNNVGVNRNTRIKGDGTILYTITYQRK